MVPSTSTPAGERPRAPAFPYLTPAAAAVEGLAPRGCRWPLGEPAEAGFGFCPAPAAPGSSYCALHRRTAHGARA